MQTGMRLKNRLDALRLVIRLDAVYAAAATASDSGGPVDVRAKIRN